MEVEVKKVNRCILSHMWKNPFDLVKIKKKLLYRALPFTNARSRYKELACLSKGCKVLQLLVFQSFLS